MFLVLGSADLRLALGIAIFSESTAHGHFRSSHQTYSSNSPAAHFCPRNHKTPLTFFVKRGLRNHCMAPSIIRVNGSLAISGIGYQQGVVLSRICGGDVLFLPGAGQPRGPAVTKGYNLGKNGWKKVCKFYTVGFFLPQTNADTHRIKTARRLAFSHASLLPSSLVRSWHMPLLSKDAQTVKRRFDPFSWPMPDTKTQKYNIDIVINRPSYNINIVFPWQWYNIYVVLSITGQNV